MCTSLDSTIANDADSSVGLAACGEILNPFSNHSRFAKTLAEALRKASLAVALADALVGDSA